MLGLHGWGRTHRDLIGCFERLENVGIGAATLDLPGFGASRAPAAAGGAAMYADLVAPVLKECAPRVVVVGHSFGGRVAVELAVRHPDRVASLVLCGVPLLRPTDRPANKPALKFRLARRLHRRGLLSEATMERMRQRYGSADYRTASGVMRAVLVAVVNETYEEQLGRIAQPVELVWGQHDEAAPVEIAHRAQHMLSDARLSVVDDVGHDVPTEAPDALSVAVRRLVAQLT